MGDLETRWTKRASHSRDPSAAVCEEQKQDKLYNVCLAVNTFKIHSQQNRFAIVSSKGMKHETQEVVTTGRGALGAPAGLSGWVVSPPPSTSVLSSVTDIDVVDVTLYIAKHMLNRFKQKKKFKRQLWVPSGHGVTVGW